MNISTSIEFHKNQIKEFQNAIAQKGTTNSNLKKFNKILWEFHEENRRPFHWRDTITPYGIVVSEIMLQQTQTDRVLPKYLEFIETFPTFESLAQADFYEVLKKWKGLGYNRRAKNLQRCAQEIVERFNGKVPQEPEELVTLPGIGPATSCSVSTFIYNKPNIFIETNIRSVFLFLFFHEQENISDKILLELIEKTIDTKKPREWYYALMDYGVFIKKTYGNPNKKSKHYTKQSRFAGSNRQIRGMILQDLLDHPNSTSSQIIKRLGIDKDRIQKNLNDLQKEELIQYHKSKYFIN